MKKRLPKISIITPSFNQAQYIEKTVQSVLHQNYPELEYIIVDGGSTDGTIEILKKYTGKLTLISEKDNGQTHAINKGLRIATGEIVAYLNSDDCLENDSLYRVGEYFIRNNKSLWYVGKCRTIDENGHELETVVTAYKNFFLQYLLKFEVFLVVQFIYQPATFWKKSIIRDVGYFDESLYYSMDYDYWLRLWQKQKPGFTNTILASYRIHRKSKSYTSPDNLFREAFMVVKRYTDSKTILFLHRLHNNLALLIYRLIRSNK